MVFSAISSRFQSAKNSLYQERDRILARGEKVIDLVSGNVNHHGIFFPQEVLEKILIEATRRAKLYRPDPMGQIVAREAIRAYYLGAGLDFPVRQILLTPGTSLSYWYCFKILANPGEEILSPLPSYPLFDPIAELSGVRLVPYPLVEELGWAVDVDRLEKAITPRSRAIIVISPHNPTGKVASEDELRALSEIAIRHGLAIISDEVFSAFLFSSREIPFSLGAGSPRPYTPSVSELPRIARTDAPLTFTLNGFSKMFALPGMKIGWMAVSGNQTLVEHAVETLETISDTFLPVGEIQQQAVPEIFSQGEEFLKKYVETIRSRAKTAVRLLSGSSTLQLTPPEGGFYLCARIMNPMLDEETLALELLQTYRLLLHPGYFYDLDPSHLVMSIVPEEEVLSSGLTLVLKHIACKGE